MTEEKAVPVEPAKAAGTSPAEPEGEFDLEGISLEEPGAARKPAPGPEPAGENAAQAGPPAPEPAPAAGGPGRPVGVVQLTWRQAALVGLLALTPSLALLTIGKSGASESRAPAAPLAAPQVREGPPKPAAWAESRKLAARGALVEAIRGLEGFLDSEERVLHPGEQIEAWLELSDWHHRIGDPEGAERYARKVVDLRLATTPVAKYFEWGEELFKDGLGFLQAGQAIDAADRFAQARRHLARFLLQERGMSGASRARIALAHERIADTLRLQADAGEAFPASGEPIRAAGGGRP